jgi:hypothetical protein
VQLLLLPLDVDVVGLQVLVLLLPEHVIQGRVQVSDDSAGFLVGLLNFVPSRRFLSITKLLFE